MSVNSDAVLMHYPIWRIVSSQIGWFKLAKLRSENGICTVIARSVASMMSRIFFMLSPFSRCFPSCTISHPEKPVSYTHLRAHETRHDLVCRLLLEKKKT